MTGAVAFVLKGYPRLSETFIANEIKALEDRGLDIRIISLRAPTDTARHPVHDEIRASVLYLPEYLYQAPRRVLAGLRASRRLPGFARARRLWLRDLRRDPTPNRVRRFGQAAVLAAELPADVGRLHAHFLHTPASVTRYAAIMRGLAWSVSAHAKDIWTSPEWEKREKLADCAWAVTCSQAAGAALNALAPDPERVAVVYHGLDPARFAPMETGRPQRDGRAEEDPIRILCVARAVEKKGLDVLLRALSRVPADLRWRLAHIGGGEDAKALKAMAAGLGLDDRIDWRGARPQTEVLAAYRESDLFVLPSREAKSGDRDGLPNVLLEAQSQSLPVIASAFSAIPELIEDGETGLLVPPGDEAALAEAITALGRNPLRRAGLGRAGYEKVRSEFAFEAGIDRITRKFGIDHRPATEDEAPCASHSTRR